MELTKFHAILILVMVATGTMNTLVAKYPGGATKDETRLVAGKYVPLEGGKGLNGVEGAKYKKKDEVTAEAHKHKFDHPFFMTTAMFLGEMSNLVVYKINKRMSPSAHVSPSQYPPMYAFWASAAFDMVSTCTFYIALGLGAASMAQMCRGASIIFTGLASKWILKRKLYPSH
eukprot:133260_1